MIQKKIEVLDCTLRDGAYINKSDFGDSTIKGVIRNLQHAKIEIIECGWLKDDEHKSDSSYFHAPSDITPYIEKKAPAVTYVVMIDYNRYDLSNLPQNDGKSIDAIRVVFPRGKAKEGLEVANRIREKGYRIFCQAANTLGYSDKEILDLITEVNNVKPECISIVDTFGAMLPEDLIRICSLFVNNLHPSIKIGFHSHNNQQLSFALCIEFVRYMTAQGRSIVVDSSLCGMGRGAGNATTELLTSFLNKKYSGNYDLDLIMDTIDMYMVPFEEKYKWGYSIPTFIAGMYCSHVNNIDYLLKNHRATAKEIRSVISSMEPDDRIKYDYDLLENKYIENQNNEVDDSDVLKSLESEFNDREILILAPGKSSIEKYSEIQDYIRTNKPVVIGINAILPDYSYDYLFFKSAVRYSYAKTSYPDIFKSSPKILLSNIKNSKESILPDEKVIRYERAIKRGWKHFDNAVICMLRLLDKLNVKRIAIAGFDAFSAKYNDSYADPKLPTVHDVVDWDKFNDEIKDMFMDFYKRTESNIRIKFLTDSFFDQMKTKGS
jgi:4-hydroxy 2-oxovalerate aldolase